MTEMNRVFLLALVLCAVLYEVNGFSFPSLCKKSCSKNSDCSGSNNRCIRIGYCKMCIKLPVKPTTTKKTTTTPTTTPTTPTTTPTTPSTTPPTTPSTPPPTPPTNCGPPPSGELVTGYICTKGNKKGSFCVVKCKANHCPTGGSSTECKCNAETCNWSRNPSGVCKPNVNQCESDEDCGDNEKCSQWRCGKRCREEVTPPECGPSNCKSNYNCPIGWSCMHDGPGFCGRCRDLSKPPPSLCRKPCGHGNSCPSGMKCVLQDCGHQCVSESTVFSCPVPVPALGEATCGKNERTCSPAINCPSDQVCCFSGACGKNVCKSKSITALQCKEKKARLCSTSANCLPSEICSVDETGCQKCTKGYSCPELLNSCETSRNCKISQSCLPDKNGCLTCQGSSSRPTRPTICLERFCLSDKTCPSGHKCLEIDGCRKCVSSE